MIPILLFIYLWKSKNYHDYAPGFPIPYLHFIQASVFIVDIGILSWYRSPSLNSQPPTPFRVRSLETGEDTDRLCPGTLRNSTRTSRGEVTFSSGGLLWQQAGVLSSPVEAAIDPSRSEWKGPAGCPVGYTRLINLQSPDQVYDSTWSPQGLGCKKKFDLLI